jgi:hypothetical protein
MLSGGCRGGINSKIGNKIMERRIKTKTIRCDWCRGEGKIASSTPPSKNEVETRPKCGGSGLIPEISN